MQQISLNRYTLVVLQIVYICFINRLFALLHIIILIMIAPFRFATQVWNPFSFMIFIKQW